MASQPLKLIIGDKSYSSWSLRAWLALKRSGLAFEEINIELAGAGSDEMREKIRTATGAGSGKVPALQHAGAGLGGAKLVVWDSLAICEYVAELCTEMIVAGDDRRPDELSSPLWPGGTAVRGSDLRGRAVARSVAAEMHSSFAALRNEMPMNVRKRGASVAGGPSAACVKDIARVAELWAECRAAVDPCSCCSLISLSKSLLLIIQ